MVTNDTIVFETVASALTKVELKIQEVLDKSGKARQAISHLVDGGGKRVRPLLTILAAGTISEEVPEHVIPVAAAAELVHTASLLHDDVIDESSLRRGKPTARLVYSNSISVLSGDHCLASAVKLIHAARHDDVMSNSLNMIADLTNGELIQLDIQGRTDTTQEVYEDICYRKTAALFVWAAQSGAVLAGATKDQLGAFYTMGRSMGIAFQIADDLLDFTADSSFGKNLMDDVFDGRLTLPLIVALKEDPELLKIIEKAFADPDAINDETLLLIQQHVLASSAVKTVQARVDELTDEAIRSISLLPENPYRQLILEKVEVLAGRSH